MKLVSIVCVTHGRPQLLSKCLQSCVGQKYPNKELIVVVNPADAETEAVISQSFPDAKVVRTHRNIGFFPALNIAIANSNGELVMTVDDDAWFTSEDDLEKLVNAFTTEPNLGAATCNLEGPKETTHEGGDVYVNVFKTGFTLVPKAAFTTWVGYYPDLFFRSAGETFLCKALWEQKRPVKLVASARMYHALATEGRSEWLWKFYGLRSQILCVLMRDPWILIPFILISKFLKSLIDYIKWGAFKAWAVGWWSSFVHFPEALALRKPISMKTYQFLRKLQKHPASTLDEMGR